jgi:hypothetical protein
MDWLYRGRRDLGGKIERRPITDRQKAIEGLRQVSAGPEYVPAKSEAEIREIKRQAYLRKAQAISEGAAA